jgi:hypothetical protein
MLFRRESRERMEPMGIVGGPMFRGPFFHRRRYDFGDFQGQFFLARLDQEYFIVDGVGQPLPHHIIGKTVASVDFSYAFTVSISLDSMFVHSFSFGFAITLAKFVPIEKNLLPLRGDSGFEANTSLRGK